MFCDIETLFDIPPEAFDPEPKVNSTVIKITNMYKSVHHGNPGLRTPKYISNRHLVCTVNMI